MLLYRPLIAAYRDTPRRGIRDYLLRQLKSPRLHAEPEEVLEALADRPDEEILTDAIRLDAELELQAQLTQLRLTTCDPDRRMGGLWTSVAAGRSLVTWTLERDRVLDSLPWLGAALNPVLDGPRETSPAEQAWSHVCRGIGRTSSGVDRLVHELIEGTMPAAAAVGIATTGDRTHAGVIIRAIQRRGLKISAPWLGVLLSRLAGDETVPILGRLVRSDHHPLESQAAYALGFFSPDQARDAIRKLMPVRDPEVRLNLLTSLGRLDDQGLGPILLSLTHPDDPDLLRVAAIRSLGLLGLESGSELLTSVLETEAPVRRAEALEAAVLWPDAGAIFLDHARQAVRSNVERLQLAGLLSLIRWSPEEADSNIHEVFAQPASRQWFMATFALRYLRSSNGVALLVRLADRARGTDLEELALSSLCRYLDDPAALTFLIDHIQGDVRPFLIRRVLSELARHTPVEHAHESAEALRTILRQSDLNAVDPSFYVALGALGDDSDLEILLSHLASPHTTSAGLVAALEGIELLMSAPDLPELKLVSEHDDPDVRTRALLTRFRLGDLETIPILESWGREPRSGTPEGARGIGHAIQTARDMLVTAMCMGRVSRLARLVACLTRRELTRSENDDSRVTTPVENVRPVTLRTPTSEGLPGILQERRPVLKSMRIPEIGDGKPAARSTFLYRALGNHNRGENLSKDRPWIAPALVAISALALVVVTSFTTITRDPEPQVLPKPISQPVIEAWISRGSLTGSRVRSGELLTGRPADPVVVYLGFLDNIVAIRGRATATSVERAFGGPRDSRLVLAMHDGELEASLHRGRSSVRIEAAEVAVEIRAGRVKLSLQAEGLTVEVQRGSALIEDLVGERTEVFEGRVGRFMKGMSQGTPRPIGR